MILIKLNFVHIIQIIYPYVSMDNSVHSLIANHKLLFN